MVIVSPGWEPHAAEEIERRRSAPGHRRRVQTCRE
jgi:hypothetical protein